MRKPGSGKARNELRIKGMMGSNEICISILTNVPEFPEAGGNLIH